MLQRWVLDFFAPGEWLRRLTSESTFLAAVATREWHGISLRDVLLFAAGLLFCLVVVRFMLAGSTEPQATEQAASASGPGDPAFDKQVEVVVPQDERVRRRGGNDLAEPRPRSSTGGGENQIGEGNG